jgi:hypothetical protein
MKTIFLTYFFLQSFFTFSQEWRTEKEDLIDNVKSINHKKTYFLSEDKEDWMYEDNNYEYDKNGYLTRWDLTGTMNGNEHYVRFRLFDLTTNLCKNEYVISKGDTISKYTFFYDDFGKTSSSILYNDGEHWSTFNYLYNEKGFLKECFVVIQRDNDTIRNLFEYDNEGRLIKDSHISSSSVIIKTWKYNQLGNLIEEKSELLKAPPSIIITTDVVGTTSKKILDLNPDDHRNYVINYSYNKLNQKVQEVRKFLDGRIQQDVIYEYDKKGYVIREYFLDINLKTKKRIKTSIIYAFDSHGNWTSKVTLSDKNKDEEETRIIEYYSN